MRASSVLLVIASLIGIAACARGGAPTLLPAGNAVHSAATRTAGSYKTIYNFHAGSDGQFPQATLTVVQNRLYGTTYSGGAYGLGSIFEVTTGGLERVVHNFKFADGSRPTGGLRFAQGALYGTTAGGGAHGQGTVFRMTPNGKFTSLHSFKAGTDGAQPLADLTEWNGAIYGTTYSAGGKYSTLCYAGAPPLGPFSPPRGCGTIFKVTASGQESRVNAFGQDSRSGFAPAGPLSNLTPLNGVLYGTTFGGPESFCSGTVYTLDASGHVNVKYYFGNSSGCTPDGGYPVGDLIVDKGVLYGTTYYGGTGTSCAGALQCGTVFSLTASGKEAVVYSFQGSPDGSWPTAGLTLLNGRLYGVTSWGGSGYGGSCGVLFSVTPSGQETVLHDFGAHKRDGCSPLGGLVVLHGTLYGATASSGLHGGGTVFAFTP